MLKIGICGLESSHADAYTQLINRDDPEPGLEGARVTHLWHWDPQGGARIKELQQKYGIEDACDQREEMIGQIDAVMIFTRDGALHRQQAMPFLEAGVPTYVDKPFAHDMQDARAMVEAARKSGAPLMSCSALRYSANLAALLVKVDAEVGTLRSALSTGPGELFFYGIHAAEVLHVVMGPGPQWVWAAHDESNDMITVRWPDGRKGVINLNRNGTSAFHLAVFGEKGWLQTQPMDDRCYPETLKAFLTMVRTRQEPIDLQHTLEIIAILVAAQRSMESRSIVNIADL